MTFHNNPSSYEEMIENAKLSFVKESDLLKIIEKVAFDNWLDKDSTWALVECFNQK